MVDIEVGELTERRRFDPITAASVVLTVDAALFLVIAVVGAPFLMFVFADDYTGTWPQMAPLVIGWVAAALLGAACATAVVRSFGSGGVWARRLGAASAIVIVLAVAVLIATTYQGTPLLALSGAPLAIANLAAAVVLTRPGVVDPADEEPEIVFIEEPEAEFEEPEPEPDFDEAEFEEPEPDVEEPGAEFEEPGAEFEEPGLEEPEFEEDGEPAEPRITVDLAHTGPGRAVPSAARRRLRGRAALQTHAGVRLRRRPRR
ncbi:hypothetical protein ODJ79_28250 [Actinoplanes sp. KI2]|uniref:hypothetical protein n=1 Tax=Actinoplanes sp. KI2 TaxID=2983315 RepID=UPI0021D612A7|nr:hypothetical protein [Actinoplanes sp. KI2]MCU7727628.1 hypothetical protein [Actinoplanes sp. KI2]